MSGECLTTASDNGTHQNHTGPQPQVVTGPVTYILSHTQTLAGPHQLIVIGNA